MADTGKQQCAVWYFRYFSARYELCDSEEEAARFAVGIENYGEGAVVGVQFPDGRTIPRDDWSALREAEAKMRAEEEARAARQKASPPVPTRQIKDPFQGTPLTVEAGEPEWLGR